MNDTAAFFRRNEVQKILRLLIDKELTTITPSLSYEFGVCYEAISREIKRDDKEIAAILEELSKLKILEQDVTGNIGVCPICSSHKLMVELRCPSCKSSKIVKGIMLEHIKCGYVDLEEKFKSGDRYVCPKCNKPLTTIGVDYRKPSVVYKCLDCNSLSPTAAKHHLCIKGHSFEEQNLIMKPVITYKFDLENRFLVEKELLEFDTVLNNFREEGWHIESPAYIEGESGVHHEFSFSIWFTQPTSALGWPDLVAEHCAEENEVSSTPLLAFQAKAMDVHSKEKILVAMPGLDENAKLLARGFSINTVEGSSAEEVKEKLKQTLLNIKQKRSKAVLEAEKAALEEALKELGGTIDRT
ncbi:MAG: hypothetical protein QXW32_04590 [Nitrososphaerales archaeon]